MYEEKKVLKIIEENGTITEAEIIVAFRLDDTNKEYVIYTLNEEDEKGNVTIYASAYEEVDGEKQLTGIATEEEWTKIKEVLRALAKA
ncbi:MAG: DUF1292 domain-containing protein [Bacilli bacterium]|nr:DUF1292 domain-containing protein [Bacilli bacterium]